MDAILKQFSDHWHSCTNQYTPDIVHSIVFSMVLLNTDLHVITSTRHKKMTRKEYIKNTALPYAFEPMLKAIYDSIKSKRIEKSVSSPSLICSASITNNASEPRLLLDGTLFRKNLTKAFSKAKNRRYVSVQSNLKMRIILNLTQYL